MPWLAWCEPWRQSSGSAWPHAGSKRVIQDAHTVHKCAAGTASLQCGFDCWSRRSHVVTHDAALAPRAWLHTRAGRAARPRAAWRAACPRCSGCASVRSRRTWWSLAPCWPCWSLRTRRVPSCCASTALRCARQRLFAGRMTSHARLPARVRRVLSCCRRCSLRNSARRCRSRVAEMARLLTGITLLRLLYNRLDGNALRRRRGAVHGGSCSRAGTPREGQRLLAQLLMMRSGRSPAGTSDRTPVCRATTAVCRATTTRHHNGPDPNPGH